MQNESGETPKFDPKRGYETIDFPSYIGYLRDANDLSQRQLSKKAGFNNSATVAQIELSRTKNPGVFTLMAIAQAFNMNLPEFIERAERFTRTYVQ